MWNSIRFQAISFVIHTLSFCKGGHGFLFWGLIVLNIGDLVFSHNWRFPSPLAHPCQFRPYFWNSTWLFSLSSSFYCLSCEDRFTGVSSPWLMIRAEYGKILAWFWGRGGRAGVVGEQRRNISENFELVFLLGAILSQVGYNLVGETWVPKYQALFMYEAQIYRVSIVVKFHGGDD